MTDIKLRIVRAVALNHQLRHVALNKSRLREEFSSLGEVYKNGKKEFQFGSIRLTTHLENDLGIFTSYPTDTEGNIHEWCHFNFDEFVEIVGLELGVEKQWFDKESKRESLNRIQTIGDLLDRVDILLNERLDTFGEPPPTEQALLENLEDLKLDSYDVRRRIAKQDSVTNPPSSTDQPESGGSGGETLFRFIGAILGAVVMVILMQLIFGAHVEGAGGALLLRFSGGAIGIAGGSWLFGKFKS